MGSKAEVEYAVFEEKVRRTVYIDNLSPHATESVLRTALDQFGTVKNIRFIPYYTQPMNVPHSALVEMENIKQAEDIILEISQFPFMISGMPRPVRARAAEVEMFENRPAKPGRKIDFYWVDPNDPDFLLAEKLKRLQKIHASEASFLLKKQLDKEEKLAKQQAKALEGSYKKFKIVEGVIDDKTAHHLADYYKISSK